MHISQRFSNNTLKYLADAKHLTQLHIASHEAFELDKSISTSEDPAKVLNSVLLNEGIFSFSFARHPYAR